MLVSLKWLNNYVRINDINTVEFADAMTMSGSKVEEIIENGKEITNVVTGKILKIEPHPDADRLVVCQVNIGNKIIQIVTGADNMKEGDVVPVALLGATLPGGIKIKKGKLRGVESNGMMCSATELGLDIVNPIHGIHILPDDTKIGCDVRDVLGLNSVIIDFEITPNRADCLSMIGIAREAGVTFNREITIPEVNVKENNENINNFIDVSIEAKDLCKRYAARIVKNIKICDSPEWMQQRLIESGIRPINNIVDITNYVMIEYGQPLHAFDYEKIEGKEIIVRRANEGEKLITLDGKGRILDSSMLVISDTKKALVVAGVMGGEDSEISNNTTTILFEAANFNGTSIRLTSKKLGFRTEASARFEKGIDPNIAILALNRAAELTYELCGGEIVAGVIDRYEDRLEPWSIEISPDRINNFLGTNVTIDEMLRILKKLGIEVKRENKYMALIPTFRSDLEFEVDIAEEIARIYGYDNIKSTMIFGKTTKGGKNDEQRAEDRVKNLLADSGLHEIITYSFISPEDLNKINIPMESNLRNTVKILNPLGEEMSIMRTTLIPSLLETISLNYNRKIEEAQFFEIGRVYLPRTKPIEKLPDERSILTIGMYGGHDFFDIKGIVELLFSTLGIKKYQFIQDNENMTFHPGKTAKILLKNKVIGIIGEIHPDVLGKYGLPSGVYVSELNFDDMIENCIIERKFKQLPKYPAVQRDMALLVSKGIMVCQIEDLIKQIGGNLVESINLFDVYEGKQIPEGQKSVAYSITYRAENRTLTDEEVNNVHNSIIKTIELNLSAQLRL